MTSGTRGSPQNIRVGKVVVPLKKAQEWISHYTDPGRTSSPHPYAYPAYDTYESNRNDPRKISDADLLAPGLLNVSLKIRSYYDLRSVIPQLEAGLANNDLELPLAQVEDPDRIAAMVNPLYGVLDDPRLKPRDVKATTLSKVLHRKRPKSLVLHDRWVRECYLGPGGPVYPAKERSWADYMTEISIAIGNDIRTQQAAFELLDDATGSPGTLSHVRLLDIVAWTSKGLSP